MKKSLLAIALATIALSSTAQAAYVYKLPLEVAGGGSLPNGTISFGNGGATTPVEPSEPEVIDPFAQENPKCDPWAEGYPGNSTGKDLIWGVWYDYSFTDGKTYRPCKLKEVQKPKLLARFLFAFPTSSDRCDPNNPKSLWTTGKKECYINGQDYNFVYSVSMGSDGVYNYMQKYVQFWLPSNAGFTMQQMDRIVFDGVACTNPRYYVSTVLGKPVVTSNTVCDLPLTYNELRAKANTPFLVEIYSK